MKKIIILSCVSFISLLSFSQEEEHAEKNFLTFDVRFSESQSYPRVYFETSNENHWGLTAGINADARGLSHIEATYKIVPGIKFAAGVGHHPYQGGFHASTGILFKKEFHRNWELEGYGRMIFNHTDFFGSEIEFQKKWEKVSFGVTTEIESGKEFLLWKDAQEETHVEKESVFLFGPSGSLKITKHMTLRGIFLFGEKVKHEEKHFFWKGGVGMKYVF